MSEILSVEAKTRSWPALVLVATYCALPFITVLAVAHFDLEDVQFGLFNLGGIVLLVVMWGLMLGVRKSFGLKGVSCCGFYPSAATPRPTPVIQDRYRPGLGNQSAHEEPRKEVRAG